MDQSISEIVRFDASVYSLETVKKAAYRHLDRFAPNIEMDGSTVVCVLNFPKGASRDSINETIDDFKKEVLDQDLRQLVANETAPYRNAILALAFSPAKLSQDE